MAICPLLRSQLPSKFILQNFYSERVESVNTVIPGSGFACFLSHLPLKNIRCVRVQVAQGGATDQVLSRQHVTSPHTSS